MEIEPLYEFTVKLTACLQRLRFLAAGGRDKDVRLDCGNEGYRKMEWEKQFDELALARGRSLCSGKRVTDLKKSDTEITAVIAGNPRYEVSISLRGGQPVRMRCQCPKFRGRSNCEHLAAALYLADGSWQAEQEKARREAEEAARQEAQRREKREKAARLEAQRQAEQEKARREAEEAARQEAQRQAEEEAARAQEEAAGKQEWQELLQQRIEQREAEKKARKAARKKAREEAQQRQQELKREEEQRKKEQELKREEEMRRREQEIRQRMEEEQKALARAQEEAARAEARKAAQEKKFAAAEADSRYCYFDFEKLRESLQLSAKMKNRGEALLRSGSVSLKEVSSGYTDGVAGMIVQADAVGKENQKTFPIRLTFSRSEFLQAYCGCRDCQRRYWGWGSEKRDCSWVAAALKLTEEFVGKHEIGDATDKTAMYVMGRFSNLRANLLVARNEHQGENLLLEPRLQKQDGMLRLSFRVGTGKLFVVKDLFEFCSHVKNSETATYGSSTEINHHPENFTEESMEWYRFIGKVIQEEERLEQRMEESMRYAWRRNRLNALELYGWRLDQFFEMMQGRTVEYEEKDNGKKEKFRLSVRDSVPRAFMQIRENPENGKKSFHGISVSCRMPEFFYGVDRAYFIEKGCLNRAQKEDMERLQVLAEAADGGRLEFQVGRRQLAEFYYSILPVLGESVEVAEENPEKIHSFLPPEVSFVFYLDAEEGDVLCRPCALYGGREVSLLDHLKEEGVLESFRMENREQEVLYQVMQLFPEGDPEREAICCSDEEQIYQVLRHGVEELAALGEVQCTERFRRMNRIRSMKVAVGVSVSEGMLDLEINTEDISRQELLDILKGYRTRRKYYRLKNGDFVNLEDNSLEMLSELMETLQLAPKEFVKGKMHLPAYRALYMDRLLEENENVYHTRDSRFRKMVKNFKTISDADFEEPAELSRILRGYQKNGYKWLRTLETYGFGGILADDMGLGKTLQMIAVLLAAKQEGQQGNSLIVSPASLVYNWEEELHRFAPQLKVLAVTGGQEARREKLAGSGAYDVLVTSYDLLKRDIDQYEGMKFLYEVIDEAQYIKNHTTAAAKAVKIIQSRHKFALTGTPIENRLSELWSIFDYLMPGFLYGYDVFRRELELPIVKSGDETALKRLQKMTGPFILRRLKQDVLKDLPDKLEEVRFVRLEEEQRRVYDAQAAHMQELLAMQSAEEFGKNKMQVLAELTRLRQICCDPSLCFENYRGQSAKLEACMELIQSAIDGGHKILLFSQFTTMLELLQQRLSEVKIPYYTITGATSKEQRQQLVKEFNRDETPLFLISLKAGGVGLNLTGADVVIHYDPWWNLAAQEQATDRAHRIGQTKKVTVYKLIAGQTVEEKILKLQEKKKNLADSIVGAQEGQLAGMSREDLLALLEV